MKRWETMAVAAVAALGLLAPAAVHAAAISGGNSIAGYTFAQPVKSGDTPVGATSPIADAEQSGDINNLGQFDGDPNPGEREFVFDGTKAIILSDADVPIKAPDGATINNGVWSPQGINNNSIVAWIADIGDGGTGPHYPMAYDVTKKTYTIVARPGDPTPEGTKFEDQAAAPDGGRMVATINDLNQVFWCTGKTGKDGNDHTAIYMNDLNAKKLALVAGPDMKTTDGKTLVDAWWPDPNNSGMCAMTATVDPAEAEWGIYLSDGKGNISPIIPAQTTIDGVKIGSARWARMNSEGDIVAVVDVDGTDNGGGGETQDSLAVAVYTAADKSTHLIVKPGDKIPGGTYHGLESSRRIVGITDSGQVFFLAVREDTAPDGTSPGDGCYRWDPKTNTIDALVLGNTTVTGLGKVGGVTKGNSGCTGYHMGVSRDGHVVFDAVVNGVEGYLVATPPKQ